MYIYIIVFVFLLGCTIINFEKTTIKWLLLCLYVIFVVFVGLRGDIDSDYKTYEKSFKYIELNDYGIGDITFEPSFYFISKFAIAIGSDYWFVTLIYAILTFGVLFYSFYQISYRLSVFYILAYYSYFFFLHAVTQIRVGLGIGLLIFSILYVKERKPFKFILTVLSASFFHISCLIFLPMYYLLNNHVHTIKVKLFLFLSALILIKYFNILPLVISQLPSSDNLIIVKLLSHQYTLENGIGSRTANVFVVVIICKFLFNIFLHYKMQNKVSPYFFYILQLHFYGCIVYILFSDMHIIAARFSDIFVVFEVLLIPMLLYVFNNLIGRIIVYIICLFQLIVSLYFINESFIRPYEFIY